ncbi:MAG TPA: hypothetical protein VKA21_10545 [Candidatus Binatia bacterium]|nr:hypothetical protein [Candidatus Binatia bacterium]
MLQTLRVLALVLCVVPAAHGAAILYATAATRARVDGFCIRADGSLARTPKVQAPTAGAEPRRLFIGANGVLYVAEIDRVEAFRINANGTLKPLGGTGPVVNPNMNPLDVALSPDGSKLYVPQNGRDRIVAYDLDAEGRPILADSGPDFRSCIQGPFDSRYQRLQVRDGYLYVTSASLSGQISVFPLAADGSLPATPDQCKLPTSSTERSDPTCPLSERRKLRTPRAFVFVDDIVYVDSLLKRRVFAFKLNAGLFTPPEQKKSGAVVSVCLKDADGEALEGPFRWQAPLDPHGKTKVLKQYQDMVLARGTLLLSQFLRGRIDAFRIRSDGGLPHNRSKSTREDVRGSPVGLAAHPGGGVVYLAAGELDRVQAFALNQKGLPDPTPFSETEEDVDSFPNALAIAQLTDRCE